MVNVKMWVCHFVSNQILMKVLQIRDVKNVKMGIIWLMNSDVKLEKYLIVNNILNFQIINVKNV